MTVSPHSLFLNLQNWFISAAYSTMIETPTNFTFISSKRLVPPQIPTGGAEGSSVVIARSLILLFEMLNYERFVEAEDSNGYQARVVST